MVLKKHFNVNDGGSDQEHFFIKDKYPTKFAQTKVLLIFNNENLCKFLNKNEDDFKLEDINHFFKKIIDEYVDSKKNNKNKQRLNMDVVDIEKISYLEKKINNDEREHKLELKKYIEENNELIRKTNDLEKIVCETEKTIKNINSQLTRLIEENKNLEIKLKKSEDVYKHIELLKPKMMKDINNDGIEIYKYEPCTLCEVINDEIFDKFKFKERGCSSEFYEELLTNTKNKIKEIMNRKEKIKNNNYINKSYNKIKKLKDNYQRECDKIKRFEENNIKILNERKNKIKEIINIMKEKRKGFETQIEFYTKNYNFKQNENQISIHKLNEMKNEYLIKFNSNKIKMNHIKCA